MKNLQFVYEGDKGSRIVSWFREHLRGIACCVNAGLPESALILLYSGIDTLGLLSAPKGIHEASGKTFTDWCEKYLLSKLQTIDGEPLTALDLWAARCGVLHTSTSVSKLGREGKVHEIWYQFKGKAGVNLMTNTKLPALGLDLIELGVAFKEGGVIFITELKEDPNRFHIAEQRAGSFFRWGRMIVEGH